MWGGGRDAHSCEESTKSQGGGQIITEHHPWGGLLKTTVRQGKRGENEIICCRSSTSGV